MKLGVVNLSQRAGLTPDVLEAMVAAVQRQIVEHFAPFWGEQAIAIATYPSVDAMGADVSPMVILDDSDQAGALGYHAVMPDGRAYARVFTAATLANGGSLTNGATSVSVTLSHEALEATADPYANFWADGPDGKQYAIEACDAVEGDYYEIDGIAVSNFVGPRWFRPGNGPFDWMSKLSAPFSMTAGGYMIVKGADGNVSQVFGQSFPAWKIEAKGHPAARTAKRAARV